MPVQTLPSGADVLQQPLEDFAKGLEKLLAPNMEFQKAMQKAVGSNPQLAQQLADLEYAAPGTLNRMGFGQLGHVLSQIPESPELQARRKKRGDIEQTEEQKIAVASGEAGVDLTRITNLLHALKENPALAADDVSRILRGTTVAGAQLQQIEADVASAQKPFKIGQARLAYDQFLKTKPELANTDWMGMARLFTAGRANGKDIADILSDNIPGTREAFLAAKKSVDEERMAAFAEHREDLRLAAALGRQGLSEERQLKSEAYSAYQRSNYMGTFSAWKTAISDPAQLAAVQEKARSGQQLTPEENALLQVGQSQEQMQNQRRLLDTRNISAAIQKTLADYRMAKLRQAPESEIQLYIDNLNNILGEKANLTGQNITAKWGQVPAVGETGVNRSMMHPLGGGQDLYFVGPDGKRIPDSDILKEPKTAIAGMSADALHAAAEIEAAADKAGALANLKKANIQLYNAVAPIFEKAVTTKPAGQPAKPVATPPKSTPKPATPAAPTPTPKPAPVTKPVAAKSTTPAPKPAYNIPEYQQILEDLRNRKSVKLPSEITDLDKREEILKKLSANRNSMSDRYAFRVESELSRIARIRAGTEKPSELHDYLARFQ